MSTCFVMQPFDGDVYDKRYETVFAPGIKDAGLEPYRVDRDPGVSVPIDSIESGIRGAQLTERVMGSIMNAGPEKTEQSRQPTPGSVLCECGGAWPGAAALNRSAQEMIHLQDRRSGEDHTE